MRTHPTNNSPHQLAVEDNGATQDEFRPHSLSKSVGLIALDTANPETKDRPSTEAEVLHHILAAEATRQELERSTNDLKQLMEHSARATREAQSATRSKSDFLAMMSHEIRTPLNGIIGMTAVLLSRELGASDRDCVETIRSAGEALLAVIDDLLDFSKIEAGQLELECADFQPAQVIHQAVQIIKGAAAWKSLSLHTEIDPALPATVRGDMIRFRQVLLNLLGNAVKFTEAGTIQLKAEVLSATEAGYQLRFSVTDEGIGISEEQQRKLFQPFTQANASTARNYGGTGLGLAICKRIVELMGGSIGLESRPGEGSTFWFTVTALPAERGLPLLHLRGPEPPPVEKNKFRLLLVEDNPLNQKVALTMLKKLGYKADVAKDGRDALNSFRRGHYDLILMDCRMPEMDGFEATRRIRSTPGHGAQVPIIAMTAAAFSKDREACFSAGMTDFLSKPVRELELTDKLHHWLSGTGRHLGLPAASARD